MTCFGACFLVHVHLLLCLPFMRIIAPHMVLGFDFVATIYLCIISMFIHVDRRRMGITLDQTMFVIGSSGFAEQITHAFFQVVITQSYDVGRRVLEQRPLFTM